MRPQASTGQTIVQKIIARHSGRSRVEVGEYVQLHARSCRDAGAVLADAQENLDRIGAPGFARPDKAIIVIDHTSSAAMGSPHAATHRLVKDLTTEFGVDNFFEAQHRPAPPGADRARLRAARLADFFRRRHIASIGAVGALNIPMASDMLVALLKDENWVTVPKTIPHQPCTENCSSACRRAT